MMAAPPSDHPSSSSSSAPDSKLADLELAAAMAMDGLIGGVVPLTTWVLISNFKVAYNLLRGPDGSFNRELAEFLDRKVAANSTPVEGVASMDVIINRGLGLWARLFWSPADKASYGEGGGIPLLLYFHGGSFVHSSADSAIYDAMCRRIARLCRVVVMSVNFRRAPEHRYPAAYEDGVESVRWAKSLAARPILKKLGCNTEECYASGDSSGGNIVHNVALMASAQGMKLAGTVLLMPMFGGQQRTPAEKLLDGKYFVTTKDRDWYWRAFLPEGSDREHPACNPFSASAEAASLATLDIPPCMVVVGGYDILQDWQFKFVHSMKRAGKCVQMLFLEEATMGFFLLPNTHLFYQLVHNMTQFLHHHHHQAAPSSSPSIYI